MELYYSDISPPSRAVLMTARTLNLKPNVKKIDLTKDGTNTKEFLAINPEHAVPVLVDKDFVLWEGGAIQSYLVNQYGNDDSLYPREPRLRAQVDRLLYFSSGTLLARLKYFVRPILFTAAKPDIPALESTNEAIGWLNKYLDGHDFAVGNSITIADYSLITNVANLRFMFRNEGEYPNIDKWYLRCRETIPDFIPLNEKKAQEFGAMYQQKLAEK